MNPYRTSAIVKHHKTKPRWRIIKVHIRKCGDSESNFTLYRIQKRWWIFWMIERTWNNYDDALKDIKRLIERENAPIPPKPPKQKLPKQEVMWTDLTD